MTQVKRRGLLAAGVALPVAAQAQPAWPTRPLRLLVAYATGGGTDAVARTLAARLQAELGQPVVVENRPGAGGNLATEAAATARPDGYTLLMGNQGPMVVNPTLFPRFRHDPEQTLDPVALVADAPLVVVAGRSSAAADLPALLAEIRQRPGEIFYASASIGSASHLAAALLCQLAGVEATHVPYRGAGPALTEVVAGNVAFMVTTLPSVAGMLQGDAVRALAVTGAGRVASLPAVPAVAETPGLEAYRATAWYGILVPRGTPEPIRARLGEAIARALATPEAAARLREEGAAPATLDAAGFARLMREERARWAELIRAAKITAE